MGGWGVFSIPKILFSENSHLGINSRLQKEERSQKIRLQKRCAAFKKGEKNPRASFVFLLELLEGSGRKRPFQTHYNKCLSYGPGNSRGRLKISFMCLGSILFQFSNAINRHLSFAWIPFLVPLGTFPDTLQWIFKLWGIPEAEQLFFVQRVRFLDFDKSSSISWLFLMLYILVHPGIRAVIVILESFGQRKIFSRAKLMIEGSHVFCHEHDVEHWNWNKYK